MNRSDTRSRLLKPSARMAEPDAALASYLDTLLSEIPEPGAAAAAPLVKDDSATADIQHQQSPCTDPESKPASARITQAAARQPEPIIPDWAKSPFQVLLCKVSGLTLGVPLTALLSILKWPDRINELPGQPGWHLGLLVYRDRKVLVVDTACLVMPERCDQDSKTKRPCHGYVLLTEQGGWGLTVDALSATVKLEQQQVRWRRGSGKPPWLAGTIIEQLSVLLDVNGLIGMLAPEQSQKPADHLASNSTGPDQSY